MRATRTDCIEDALCVHLGLTSCMLYYSDIILWYDFAAMPDFRRKPNRLPLAHYVGPRSYLVTLCVVKRRSLFVSPGIVQPLIALLGELAQLQAFDVCSFCFMPGSLPLSSVRSSRGFWPSSVGPRFKGRASVHLLRFGYHSVWQTAYHDHIIRNDQDLQNCAAYVNSIIRSGRGWSPILTIIPFLAPWSSSGAGLTSTWRNRCRAKSTPRWTRKASSTS